MSAGRTQIWRRQTGATLDRAGRVIVQVDLSLAGHPEIAVIDDLASATSHRSTTSPGCSGSSRTSGS